ncbi:hypothetical protein LINPERHAP1_LOCUS14633 [Linum perenne]
MEEEVRGAVQTRPVPSHLTQLHGVGGVRPPRDPPQQHLGRHDQRRRNGDPACVRRSLPDLLRQEEAGQGPLYRATRNCIHRRATSPCLTIFFFFEKNAETGDKDEERGVHAVLPFVGVISERRLLDRLCLNRNRLEHHYSEWNRGTASGGSAYPVRRFLQIDAEADCREEGRRERRRRRWGAESVAGGGSCR